MGTTRRACAGGDLLSRCLWQVDALKALKALGANAALRRGVMSEVLSATSDENDSASNKHSDEGSQRRAAQGAKDVTPPAEKLRALWQEMQRAATAGAPLHSVNMDTLVSVGSEESSAYSADSVTVSSKQRGDDGGGDDAASLHMRDLEEDAAHADVRNGSEGYVQRMVVTASRTAVAVKYVPVSCHRGCMPCDEHAALCLRLRAASVICPQVHIETAQRSRACRPLLAVC
jgi:hypothetical protein